jgi:hypothetical protein
MSVLFTSQANYQPVVNAWTRHPVTLSLEDSGRFMAVSNEDKAVILDIPLSQIERIYDYYYAIILTVNGKQYKFNFSKPISIGKSLLFWGFYNWTAPFIKNPLKGVKEQWLRVFEERGVKPYRDKLGRSVLIGILVPTVLIALCILGIYVFIIRK